MILVSACLVGIQCRYDGKHGLVEKVADLVKEGKAMSVCPEVISGLPTPRTAAEIVGGTGANVLDGTAKIIDKNGVDVTTEFIAGAYRALEYAKNYNITTAILKEHSPSCGSSLIYDGTFSGKKIAGEGVTAALFRRNGINVFSEINMEQCLFQKDE